MKLKRSDLIIKPLEKIFQKHKSIILYIIFGVLTTAVNYLVFWIFNSSLGNDFLSVSLIVSWIVSVLFAFFTNRKWVFSSKASSLNEKFAELFKFFSSRIFSGVLDFAIVKVAVLVLFWDANWVKLGSNFLVIVINYFASKLFVFREK